MSPRKQPTPATEPTTEPVAEGATADTQPPPGERFTESSTAATAPIEPTKADADGEAVECDHLDDDRSFGTAIASMEPEFPGQFACTRCGTPFGAVGDQDRLDWINANPEIAIVALTEGGHLEESVTTEEVETEVEVFSPGEINPRSGLYRAVGSEIALSESERFPPPPPSTGWVLSQATDRKEEGS